MPTPKHERRKHKRLKLECPVRLERPSGKPGGKSRTIDVSDGGTLLPAPEGFDPAVGQRVIVHISVPRRTPNTFLLEEFEAPASVVRADPAKGGGAKGQVALKFDSPLDLGLEV
jgi:hypothetical protein